MDDFGAFVLANLSPKSEDGLEDKEAVGPSGNATYLVDQFVATFPGFDDHYEIDGEKVYLLKRAQLAVACIHRRFKVHWCCALLWSFSGALIDPLDGRSTGLRPEAGAR
ncbi:unnamed protein product [Phytophthora fragariaefolia]|uniref:Unnamed protein product n=1 Tax=Phytophthora fragariaefolia TaxID=1490495 RepID=A0A9W6WSQ7_9STRA|nr:unnamed protein product [Phytophthora fragariaefolia]